MSEDRIQFISTESNFGILKSCPHCTRKLKHDYFTISEMQEKSNKKLKLGTKQRLSVCIICKIQYINSKI